MKKIAIRIAALLMVVAAACGCSSSELKTQNDTTTLSAINRNVDSVYNALKQSYETFQPAEMDRALDGFNKYLAEASLKLSEIKVEKDCQQLHDAVSSKVGVMLSVASNEAKEQVRIYKIPDSDFTAELRQQWDDISATVDKKVSAANAKVNQAIETINQKSKQSGK